MDSGRLGIEVGKDVMVCLLNKLKSAQFAETSNMPHGLFWCPECKIVKCQQVWCVNCRGVNTPASCNMDLHRLVCENCFLRVEKAEKKKWDRATRASLPIQEEKQ